MTAKILPTILFTLFMLGAVDLFVDWYELFLNRRGVSDRVNLLIRRATLVILAFLFWRSMVDRIHLELSSTHFLFALFAFCFYRLIASFFKESSKKSSS